MSTTCAVTGETSSGKHYVLKTTEGEELVSPLAFTEVGRLAAEVQELRQLWSDLEESFLDLRGRLEGLEGPGPDIAPQDPAAETAAPPRKRAPAPRKAAD